MTDNRLILASGSPRRRQLLELIGMSFVVKPADVDETPLSNPGLAGAGAVLFDAEGRCAEIALFAPATVSVAGKRLLGVSEEEALAENGGSGLRSTPPPPEPTGGLAIRRYWWPPTKRRDQCSVGNRTILNWIKLSAAPGTGTEKYKRMVLPNSGIGFALRIESHLRNACCRPTAAADLKSARRGGSYESKRLQR